MSGFLGDLKNSFLATGVGSMPQAQAAQAVDAVFDALSFHVPFWPQLPRLSFYENMYVQFGENLPGLSIDEKEKSVWVDTTKADYLEKMEECFIKTQSEDVDYFAIRREYAQGLFLLSQRLSGMNWQGWVKAQLIGPLSLGLTLLDESKNPILYNAELGELLPLVLGLKAAWLVKHLRVHQKTKVVIFIDEPYLVAVGTSSCSLPQEKMIQMIDHLVGCIHQAGAYAGLHCCGNTDWDLVMQTGIDILNFDAYGYLDKLLIYESALEKFLDKGRLPAVGIVPNNEDIGRLDIVDDLVKRLKAHPRLFKNGALITTSCGCSGLTDELAIKTLSVSVELAEKLQKIF